MKVRSILRHSKATAVVLLGPFLWSCVAWSNGGGGPAPPLTPYGRNGPPADEANVKRLKQNASRHRRVAGLIPISNGDRVQGLSDLGIAYVKSGQTPRDVQFAFSGKNDKGAKATVLFSEVEAFTVGGTKNNAVRIEIDRFPAITAAELVKKKPSYTRLRAGCRKKVRLWIPLRDRDGAVLSLVGTESSGRESTLALKDIDPNRRLELYRRDRDVLWWAIPSVTSDPAYPFRDVVAA